MKFKKILIFITSFVLVSFLSGCSNEVKVESILTEEETKENTLNDSEKLNLDKIMSNIGDESILVIDTSEDESRENNNSYNKDDLDEDFLVKEEIFEPFEANYKEHTREESYLEELGESFEMDLKDERYLIEENNEKISSKDIESENIREEINQENFSEENNKEIVEGFTDRELSDMEEVDRRIAELMETKEFKKASLSGRKDLAENLLQELLDEGLINHSLIPEEDYLNTVSFEYNCNVLGGIMLEPFNPMFN